LRKIGKKPVLVRKEIPGFIINRLTGAMEREIDYLLEQGVVSPEDLDTAVKASYGFRLACLGPMEAEDMIGLDTAARASANIFPTLSNAQVPSDQLLEKVNKGEIGIKSGVGWYPYPEAQKAQKIAKNNQRMLRQLQLFQQKD
jgi:3-hydroxyacyl-CoA dehydrogenase